MKSTRVYNGFAWLFGFCAIVSFFYYWDTTRIYYKKFTAKDIYQYEEINPKYLNTDPRDLLTISNVHEMRKDLVSVIFGEQDFRTIFPFEVRPLAENNDLLTCFLEKKYRKKSPCYARRYRGWENVKEVYELLFEMDHNHVSNALYFEPEVLNNKLVIYHHGYAGTFHDQGQILKELIQLGYSVIAINLQSYGDYQIKSPALKKAFKGDFKATSYPLRFLFAPIAGSINFAQKNKGITNIYMMGLSAGGWSTAVASAIDERIEKSYPISGVLPIYLRRYKETAQPQMYEPMLEAANYLNMFVLAADRPSRRQIQFFNRYDRCCFNSLRPTLYEKAVQEKIKELNLGQFKVVMDETHPRHKISRWTLNLILKDMKKP